MWHLYAYATSSAYWVKLHLFLLHLQRTSSLSDYKDVTSPKKELNSTLVRSFPNPPQHCPWYSPFASSQTPTIPRLAAKLPFQSSLMENIPFLSVKINLGLTLSKQPTFFFSSESYNRPEKDGSFHSRFLHLNPYSNLIFLIPYIEWWCETLWY